VLFIECLFHITYTISETFFGVTNIHGILLQRTETQGVVHKKLIAAVVRSKRKMKCLHKFQCRLQQKILLKIPPGILNFFQRYWVAVAGARRTCELAQKLM